MAPKAGKMTKAHWKAFPYADAVAYGYAGATLKTHWSRLHRGDCEPYPETAGLKQLIGHCPQLEPAKQSIDAAATTLQDAWRAYHSGDFARAVELGVALGPMGYNVANKATNIYATYLEKSDKAKLDLFLASGQRAEQLAAAAATIPNAWYFYAQAIGRYSQGISVVKALAEGYGGKVKHALERAIALEPRHADAHIALGAYHAEIINKIGATIGGLTYGASREAGVKHFESALKLNPHSAIARIEYANGLVMMFGESMLAQATKLYEEAAGCPPADAMERLDAELAKSELED
jgi:tetratricopeptide (TPR) repeat protein